MKLKPEKIEWLTLKEAAEHCHLGVRSIHTFIYEKGLPSYKPSKHRLVKRHELDAFLESSKAS